MVVPWNLMAAGVICKTIAAKKPFDYVKIYRFFVG
jgi:hypothetical protein